MRARIGLSLVIVAALASAAPGEYEGSSVEARTRGGPTSGVSVDLNSGLIGHWTFDEGVGATAYDLAGHGNGTIHNGAWARGIGSNALNLPGGTASSRSMPQSTGGR
jgi:hypothetical protein